MKLIHFHSYDLAGMAVVKADAPNPENQFAQAVLSEIASHTDAGIVVEQYSTFYFGYILCDEGLAISHTETLSLNDDHYQPDDLDLFYDTALAGLFKFGAFCWFENGMLTVLFFAA